jgi:hypothetical protein
MNGLIAVDMVPQPWTGGTTKEGRRVYTCISPSFTRERSIVSMLPVTTCILVFNSNRFTSKKVIFKKKEM